MASPKYEKIGRYLIRRVLGSGAMGSVYAAFDPKLNREVAIKVMPERLATDLKARARFHREARSIAALRHSNIVEIYDYSGQQQGPLYLVMEKLEGEDLFSLMQRIGMFSELAVAAIGHELALALESAHAAGIIHRDIKPENVFLTPQGRIVLTDFGIVKAIRQNDAVEGHNDETDVIGTPGFMAPELLEGKRVGPGCDIYALGILLYNLATLRMPFEGSNPLQMYQAACQEAYEDPRLFNPALSEEFCQLIAQCLKANAKQRPATAGHIAKALEKILADLGNVDVRATLRAYFASPNEEAKQSLSRAVSHTLMRLKAAVKDHELTFARRLKSRVLQIDPTNSELRDITGISAVTVRTGKQSPHGGAAASPWLQLYRALIAAETKIMLALGRYRWQLVPAVLLGVLAARLPSLQRSAAELTAKPNIPVVSGSAVPQPSAYPQPAADSKGLPPPSEEAGSTQSATLILQLQAEGGMMVWVDGVGIGQLHHSRMALSPGQHLVEVVSGTDSWRQAIFLQPQEVLTVQLPPKEP